MIAREGYAIQGLGFGPTYVKASPKAEDFVEAPKVAGIYTSHGTLAEYPAMVGVVTGEPHFLLYENATLVAGYSKIEGTILPVGLEVHVSTVPESSKNFFERLVAQEIKKTTSTDQGEFVIELTSDEVQAVIVWAELPFQLNTDVMGNIDFTISYETDKKILVKQVFTFRTPEQTTIENHYIEGTCPLDASQVFISLPTSEPAEAEEMLIELQNSVVASAIPEQGHYRVYPTEPLQGESSYYAWCLTMTSSVITATYYINGSVAPAVCLSGDTLIKMADGSERPLREIQIGDLVLAGDLTPTKVVKIAHGPLSGYHTLYYFEDGITVDEAHRHRFYNVDQGFWQYLDGWKLGERARLWTGKDVRLLRFEAIEEPCQCFGLWTESRDYYAEGLLSGETAANQKIAQEVSLDQVINMLSSLEASKLEKLYEGFWE